MKYNLILNGSLKSLTTIPGSKYLTWLELEKLMDGNTTSSGVVLINSDVLDLEVDLSNRIKIDGIKLYISGAVANDIKFYYKNSETESYAMLTTQSDPEYFYTTISQPSAPRFVRTTISGVIGELYEFQIFNDDYFIGFGTDGSLLAQYLENTPTGEEGDPTAVAIFNNSTDIMPANAYVCIDYTATDADNYIKISSSINGTYYGVEDGALVEDDKENSVYRWSMGEFDNTKVSSNNVILTDPTISGGVYTSPIFGLDNKYMASYFITEGVTESGTSSISYDESVYDGTIRVRSSNTEPLCVDEVYWIYYVGGNKEAIMKGIIYNGSVTNQWVFALGITYHESLGTAVNRRNGNVAMIVGWGEYNFGAGMFIYNRAGNLLYEVGDTGDPKPGFDVNGEFDKFGGIWGYGALYSKYLMHYSNNLDTILYQLNDGTDFLYDLAVEMNGDGIWYTNKLDNMLIHLDTDGTVLHQSPLNKPRAICGTLDNGCWVIDNTDEKAYRYNFNGALIKTVNLGRTATRMTTDMQDGFWYISSNHVYHVTSNGVENIDVELNQPTKVKGGYNGCIVWSSNNDWAKYVDNNGSIIRTFIRYDTGYPALFSFRHADFVEFRNTTNIIPASYDPVWKGSLEWKEVRKNGYFLPKAKYHQSEITLRNNDGISTPTLKKLIIPLVVKIQDIQPQTSKNVYVKTVVPDGADIADYESRLKCWWGINA